MDTAKHLTENIRLLRSGVEYPYRGEFFKELEVWKKLTKSDKLNFYWADLDIRKLYAVENSNEFKSCDLIIDYPGSVCGVAAYFKEIYVIDDVTNMGEEGVNVKVEHPNASSVICVPIVGSNYNVLGVMELYKENKSEKYSKLMIECVKESSGWIGIVLEESIKSANFKCFVNIVRSSEKYLNRYSQGTIRFSVYLQSLVSIINQVAGAEKTLVYEMDSQMENSMLVYYGMPICYRRVKKSTNFRFVKLVAESKKILKFNFEKEDQKITNEFLLGLKIKINNIIVLPVLSGDDVLAVLQCVNCKNDDDYSNKSLEYVFKFCRVGFQLKKLQDNLDIDKARTAIVVSRLKYQTINSLDVHREFEYNMEDEHIGEFYFYPKRLDIIFPAVSYMFKSLCKELIVERTLDQFLILVQKCHNQNLPFHNIFQSCDSANTMYSIILRNLDFFKDYEVLTLLICSYIYAIDSNGLSNSVLETMKHPLTVVYFANYKEKNKVDLGTFLIERTGLLAHLPQEMQEKIMKLFSAIVLMERNYNTTTYRVRLEKSFKSKPPPNWSDTLRTHWLQFLTWCSNHSRYAKPFKVAKKITNQVYDEYYQNTELLQKHGIRPKPYQTVEYADNIFYDELTYLRSTLMPSYTLLKEVFPSTHELYDATERTMDNYQNALALKGKSIWHLDVSIGLAKND